MSTSPWFWDRFSKGYADAPIKHEEDYADTLQRVRKHLNPGNALLEVACGTGTTALRLADAVRSIVATDFSPALVDICKQRQQAAQPSPDNVAFAVGRVAEPPGEDASYDGVIVMNALHLLAEPRVAMCALAAKMKPGAVFVSKSFCFGNKWGLRAALALPQLLRVMPRINFFSPAELQKLHTDAGLTIVETKVYDKCGRRLIIARKSDGTSE